MQIVFEKKKRQTDDLPFFVKIGGDEGDRTPGLSIANAALSQLSYIPIRRFKVRGSNFTFETRKGDIML